MALLTDKPKKIHREKRKCLLKLYFEYICNECIIKHLMQFPISGIIDSKNYLLISEMVEFPFKIANYH